MYVCNYMEQVKDVIEEEEDDESKLIQPLP